MPESTKEISVLIADDHLLVAEIVRSYLEVNGEFVVDHAGDLKSALSAIGVKGAFDIVLLDLNMPGMNGIGGVERVVQANQGGSVILFSGAARQEAVFKALKMGARGYVPKTLPARSLRNAIRFVHSGEVFVPSDLTAALADGPSDKGGLLTDKEHDVLRALAMGDSNKDIASWLGMTEVTVKMHVRSICTKLGVANRTQVAMAALTRGLI